MITLIGSVLAYDGAENVRVWFAVYEGGGEVIPLTLGVTMEAEGKPLLALALLADACRELWEASGQFPLGAFSKN